MFAPGAARCTPFVGSGRAGPRRPRLPLLAWIEGRAAAILRGMSARWSHVVLKVSDLDRSIAFYRRFCGLEIVRDGRPRGHTVWLAPPGKGPGHPAFVLVLYLTEIDCRLDHLGFECDSREEVDAVAAEGRELGILAQPAVDVGGDLGYLTMIRDPDGHVVEFTHGQPLAGL